VSDDPFPTWLEYAAKHWGRDWAIQRATAKARAEHPGRTFVTPGVYAESEARYAKAKAQHEEWLKRRAQFSYATPEQLQENEAQFVRWAARFYKP
jgi:hypothetical protein